MRFKQLPRNLRSSLHPSLQSHLRLSHPLRYSQERRIFTHPCNDRIYSLKQRQLSRLLSLSRRLDLGVQHQVVSLHSPSWLLNLNNKRKGKRKRRIRVSRIRKRSRKMPVLAEASQRPRLGYDQLVLPTRQNGKVRMAPVLGLLPVFLSPTLH